MIRIIQFKILIFHNYSLVIMILISLLNIKPWLLKNNHNSNLPLPTPNTFNNQYAKTDLFFKEMVR